MKTKKKLLLLLSAILLTATLITCFALFAGAESVVPEMKITNCSLSFSDSVYIKYAVKTNVDDLKLLVWTEPQADYTVGTEKYSITDHYSEKIGGVSHEIFDFKQLSVRMMTDNIYVRAYAKVGDTDYYSDPSKYSILQYAYNKLGKTATASTSETLKTLLADMLTYGASAQKHFNYKTTHLATADWYQVKLTKGTLDDGFALGLQLEGDTIKLVAPEQDEHGSDFVYWADSTGKKVAMTATASVIVGKGNETYTPKYAGELEFDSNGDGTCYIAGMGDTNDSELVIPSVSPDGDTVIGISASAFAGESITSVSIPHTIEEIGRRAFNGCTSLTDIYYDGTADDWAKINISSGNDILSSVTIHFKEVAGSQGLAYSINNDNLTCTITGIGSCEDVDLVIPSEINGYAVTALGDSAFESNTKIKTVTIPTSVTSIGTKTFKGCTKLVSISIPESVTSISTYAFSGATALTSVKLPSKMTAIAGYTFNGCTALTSVSIPDGVTSIGTYAFSGCTKLKETIIPKKVTNIGDYAYYNCTNLASVTIPDCASLGSYVFSNCTNIQSVTITDGIGSNIGNWCFNGKKKLNKVTIEKGVTTINQDAFEGCSALVSISLPDSVTKIGSYAFDECSMLENIELSENLTTIGGYAFYNCTAIEKIKLPNNLQTIGAFTFGHCNNLISIDIPDSVTSLGYGAFYYCSNLTSAKVGTGITRFSTNSYDKCGTFEICSRLTSIVFSNSVDTIDRYTFSGCSNLKSVYFIGTEDDWANIYIGDYNSNLTSATRYYFSETEPTESGNYWHFVDGVPTVW